jgi:hypothetical protein
MMNHQTLRRSFIAFHLTLAAVVFVESIATVLRTHTAGGASHFGLAVAVLASAEALAAILFVVPATLRAGALSLLAIFLFALAFHGLHGELQSTLLVYAAGVFFVLVHGSAFGKGDTHPRAA